MENMIYQVLIPEETVEVTDKKSTGDNKPADPADDNKGKDDGKGKWKLVQSGNSLILRYTKVGFVMIFR